MVSEMKVKELVEKLQKLDQDAMVIVSGYEGGYDEVDTVEKKEIALNAHTSWYYGKHDDADYYDGEQVKAVYIG